MESQPQNPEFRNNPENFHTCNTDISYKLLLCLMCNFACILSSLDFFIFQVYNLSVKKN